MATSNRVVCLLLDKKIEEAQLHALAEACGRFSPQVALRPGSGPDPSSSQAVFIEISGTQKLFSEEMLFLRLFSLARRFRPTSERGISVAIAEDPATALAFARYFKKNEIYDKARLPLQALHDYADPFYEERHLALHLKLDRMIELLKALGLKTLGDFLALPVADLVSRFGREALEIIGRIRGEIPIAWKGFYPVPKILEKTNLFDSCGESLEALLFVLKSLVDRVMARLRGRCERASMIEVLFELERSSSPRRWVFSFSVPQGSNQAVIPIIRERLLREFEKEPLLESVQSISLEVLEVTPSRGAQRNFFSTKEDESEVLDSLIARIDEKLGSGCAFLARPVQRYLPEKAYEKCLDLSQVALAPTELRSVRPSRLLRTPEKFLLQRNIIFRQNGTQWRTIRWEGPERISGEWWGGEGFQRDYFRILVESGELLWIFKDSFQSYYLHGFFD